jgi:hypothetical protein
MTETLDSSAFEPIADVFTPLCELEYEAGEVSSYDPPSEFAPKSQLPLWQPEHPQYCKAIAEYYGVSRKTVQLWYGKIAGACSWWSETDLKLPDGRYTPLCIELMGDYRLSGLLIDAWTLQIQERFADQIAALSDSLQETPDPPTESSSAMVPYQPTATELAMFDPPTLKTFRFTDKREFASSAALKLRQGMEFTMQNTSKLDEALLEQLESEGEMLGVLMFQRKYGRAQEKFTQLQDQLAKKSGLAADVESPPSDSAA